MTPTLKAQFHERLMRDLAERLRKAIASNTVKSRKTTLRATVSLGIGCVPDHRTPPEHLISLADKALYVAKTAGRNQVRWNDQPHPVAMGPSGEKKETVPCREASSEITAVVG
jgi:predicted signal transduction protein with EAL and GGDEF domain